jgi:hypothetical protein
MVFATTSGLGEVESWFDRASMRPAAMVVGMRVRVISLWLLISELETELYPFSGSDNYREAACRYLRFELSVAVVE